MADKTQVERAIPFEEFLSEDQIEYAKVQGFKPTDMLFIGSVTAGDIIVWTEAGTGEAKRTAGLRLIVKSLVDGIPDGAVGGPTILPNGQKATGKRIANDTHIEALRGKSHKVTERLVREILKLNGMEVKKGTTEADEQAKNA